MGVNIEQNIKQEIKEAMFEVLEEAGMIKNWLSHSEAQRKYGLSRRQIDNGIREGKLRAQKGPGKNCKINILKKDLNEYRNHLISINKLKIK